MINDRTFIERHVQMDRNSTLLNGNINFLILKISVGSKLINRLHKNPNQNLTSLYNFWNVRYSKVHLEDYRRKTQATICEKDKGREGEERKERRKKGRERKRKFSIQGYHEREDPTVTKEKMLNYLPMNN